MHVTPRAIAGCIGKQSFDSCSAGCCVMCELGAGSSMDFARSLRSERSSSEIPALGGCRCRKVDAESLANLSARTFLSETIVR